MFYQIHRELKKVLESSLGSGVFTSCEVGFFYKEEKKYMDYTFYIDKNFISFNSKKYFDLASLTKIFVTIPCIWSLLSEKKISMDTNIYDIYTECNVTSNKTIGDLVNHISGLAAHKDFSYMLNLSEKERFDCIENYILKRLAEEKKGEVVYSDLGYILLGRIIEKISGKRLDEYWFEKVFKTLNLKTFSFPCKKEKFSEKFIPTGICKWKGKSLQGIVNDDNCRLLGGICGHAGLFGNCSGLLNFLKKILLIYKGDIQLFPLANTVLQENLNKNIKTRRFGFDTPSRKNSSCGEYFSDLTIGHLGFTGTSVWLDLKKELGVVLLTNRTYKGNEINREEIRSLRPKVHDIIMKGVSHSN